MNCQGRRERSPGVQYKRLIRLSFTSPDFFLTFFLEIPDSFVQRSTMQTIMAMNTVSHLPVIPAITKVSKSVIRILGCNPGKMTLQGTNTYLIGTGRKQVLKDENVAIENILITHWHNDHIGGVKDVLAIEEAKGCKVWKFPRTDADDHYPDLPTDLHPLRDGQKFAVEGQQLRLFTPQGTQRITLLSRTKNPGRYSVKILQLEPTVIYPAHGSIIENPNERIKYYIMHRNKREEAICELLKGHKEHPFTDLDIVKAIYKDTPTEMWPVAAYNVNHHLRKLAKEGKVIESTADDKNYWENV
uniref:Metallo-beta-lactamase domain-containing protein n=2 Tax=Lutzomyia longipalpis TaxID=7200 RepID=A0A1B0EXE7_LUTLO